MSEISKPIFKILVIMTLYIVCIYMPDFITSFVPDNVMSQKVKIAVYQVYLIIIWWWLPIAIYYELRINELIDNFD